MALRYLLATLSAIAKKIASPSGTDTGTEGNTVALNNKGIYYFNVSPIFGSRFPRRKRSVINLLPKSIIMAMIIVITCLFFGNIAFAARQVTAISVAAQGGPTVTYGTSTGATYVITLTRVTVGTPQQNDGLAINWTGATPAGVTLTPTSYNPGSGGTVTITLTTSATTPAGVYSFTITNTDNNGAAASTSNVRTLTVSAKAVTITATNVSKVYGNALSGGAGSTAFTTSGMANGETIGSVTIAYGTGSAANASVAGSPYNNSVTPSAPTGGTFTASNYSFSYASGSITVTTLTITESGATVSNKVYNGNTTAAVSGGTLSGVVGGDVVNISTTGTFASANVGNNIAVTLALTGANAGNYTLTNPGLTANITAIPITITATGPAKTYGTSYTNGSSTSNFSLTSGSLVSGQSITNVYFNYDANAASSTTPVGTSYTVTPSLPVTGSGGFLSGNYNITFVAYTGTVTGAILTITGNSVSQVYGAVDPTVITSSSYTITGYINGDNSSSLYLLPTASTSVTTSSNAGIYPVTVSGCSAPSYYTINYVSGNFTITGAPLTITATGPSETAGVAPTSGVYSNNFTYSGTVNNETITGVTLTFNPTTAQTAGSTYTVTPSLPTGPGTFLASNYIITYTPFSGTCENSFTWQGGTSNNWSTASNWSGNAVPGTNDIATIPNTAVAPTITANSTVYSLSFTGNNSITINGGFSLTVNKALTVPSGVNAIFSMGSTTSNLTIGTNTSAANISNSGNFTVTGGTLKVNAGTNYIYNSSSGVFTVNGGNAFDITGNGSSGNTAIYNAGTFYVGQSGSACILTFDDSQSIMNLSSGSFYIGPTSVLRYFNGSAHDCIVTNQSGGTFTLQSDATGSACIYASPSTTNKFVGTFTVERYFNGHRGYRLLSSPVNSGTSGSNYVYSLNYVQNYAYISGTTGLAGGFDKTGNPTIYIYREDVPPLFTSFIDGSFQGINNLNSGTGSPPTYTFDYTNTTGSYSIPVTNGFLFYYRGNRNSSTYTQTQQFTAGNPAESVTMSTSGNLNTGQFVFRDWYTPASTTLGWSNASVISKGFNLVGNPYPCNLDLNTYNTSSTTTGIYCKNVSAFFYELNPVTQNYDTYQAVSPYVTTNSASRYIMSGQGFFVLATNTGALLTLNETAKIQGTGTNFAPQQNTGGNLFMDLSPVPLAVNRYIKVKMAKDSINTDDVVVTFVDGVDPKYDPNIDAYYRQGSGMVSLSVMSSDNIPLAISERNLTYHYQVIPLSVNAKTGGTYQLNASQIVAIPPLMNIWLKDNFQKDSVDLRTTANYAFTISKADTNTYGSRRFELVMTQNPAYAYQLINFNAHKLPFAREVKVVWETKYEENYTHFSVERSINGGRTFETIGIVPATGAGNYGFIDKRPEEGINLYRLKQEDVNSNVTYSRVVPIAYHHEFNYFAENSIRIYPNPAAGHISLAIAAQSSEYDILISNSSGNMLKRITSNQPYWQGDVGDWLPGTYMVKVFDNKTQSLVGTTKFIKL